MVLAKRWLCFLLSFADRRIFVYIMDESLRFLFHLSRSIGN